MTKYAIAIDLKRTFSAARAFGGPSPGWSSSGAYENTAGFWAAHPAHLTRKSLSLQVHEDRLPWVKNCSRPEAETVLRHIVDDSFDQIARRKLEHHFELDRHPARARSNSRLPLCLCH
jgi:hypothetical protein